MYSKYLKDPLLWISVALAIVGGIQANTGQLATLATKYPTEFGIGMMLVSGVTGALTVLKSFLMNIPKDPPQ